MGFGTHKFRARYFFSNAFWALKFLILGPPEILGGVVCPALDYLYSYISYLLILSHNRRPHTICGTDLLEQISQTLNKLLFYVCFHLWRICEET